ncbi:MAG: hypothetical protein ACYCSS_09065 [Sulfuriferula sp.]
MSSSYQDVVGEVRVEIEALLPSLWHSQGQTIATHGCRVTGY